MQLGMTLGRLGLLSLFVLGGLNKLLNYSATLASMAAVGLPLAEWLLPLTILLELGGGIIVAVGHRRWAAPLALVLAGFTLLVNVVYHNFWGFEDPLRQQLELSLFFKNVAIAGGLVFLAASIYAGGASSAHPRR